MIRRWLVHLSKFPQGASCAEDKEGRRLLDGEVRHVDTGGTIAISFFTEEQGKAIAVELRRVADEIETDLDRSARMERDGC
jgi:hypothetical protein